MHPLNFVRNNFSNQRSKNIGKEGKLGNRTFVRTLFCARVFDRDKRLVECWNRKIWTKSIRKVDLRDRQRTEAAEDWSVPLKIVPKVCGHWPCGLPPRESASYIEHLAWNFIFRTESQCQGSLPGSNEVSTLQFAQIRRHSRITRYFPSITAI